MSISAKAQDLVSSAHNLSVSGPNSIKATSETEICIFCHTPHNSNPSKPLWNRTDPGISYTIYNSSTVEASIGQPDGSSILCLSCHDGTIALGSVSSKEYDIGFNLGITTLPEGESNLSTDLSDDHPVSFEYNSVLATMDLQLLDPSALPIDVQLEEGKLQCTTCHEPHRNEFGNFLVVNPIYSGLCISCHDISNWAISSHKNSLAIWNSVDPDPWPNSNFTNVSENGCENCHVPHSASGQARILKYSSEEDNCLLCHNGNVAVNNIQNDMLKPYRHNVYAYLNLHDISEDGIVATMHVECQDCHNGHQSNNTSASAPSASGAILGVNGANSSGSQVDQIQYEYELCYKCHSDSPGKPGSVTTRNFEQNNVRLEFDLNNPSFHPIEGAGVNPDVKSLISPLTEASIIYCTDCHASDGAGSSNGPHGSIYPQILKYQYSKTYGTLESYQSYELCYQCHDRDEIINGVGRFQARIHRRHIVVADIPCNFCHDPHGISSAQGNSSNSSHLINFDLSEALPIGTEFGFEDLGDYSGRCYTICHGWSHDGKSY
ncbi:cytochrome c3 family protein [Bacteroidota bacterium]